MDTSISTRLQKYEDIYSIVLFKRHNDVMKMLYMYTNCFSSNFSHNLLKFLVIPQPNF